VEEAERGGDVGPLAQHEVGDRARRDRRKAVALVGEGLDVGAVAGGQDAHEIATFPGVGRVTTILSNTAATPGQLAALSFAGIVASSARSMPSFCRLLEELLADPRVVRILAPGLGEQADAAPASLDIRVVADLVVAQEPLQVHGGDEAGDARQEQDPRVRAEERRLVLHLLDPRPQGVGREPAEQAAAAEVRRGLAVRQRRGCGPCFASTRATTRSARRSPPARRRCGPSP
jgi:hypothetical protein